MAISSGRSEAVGAVEVIGEAAVEIIGDGRRAVGIIEERMAPLKRYLRAIGGGQKSLNHCLRAVGAVEITGKWLDSLKWHSERLGSLLTIGSNRLQRDNHLL